MLRVQRLTPAQVPGTGAHGRITPADVAAAGADTAAGSPSNGSTATGSPATGSPSKGSTPREFDDRAGLASPLARRLLRRAGLTVTEVAGTGWGGRVTHDDARRAVDATRHPGSTPGAPTTSSERASTAEASSTDRGDRSATEPLTPTRRTLAERMHRSLRTSAQLTAAVEVDLTLLMVQRRRAQATFRQRNGIALTPFPLIASAVCAVLARHPVLNARIDTAAGTATYVRDVHLGITVDTDHGPVVPTISNAQELDVVGLTRRVTELAARARDQQLRPDDRTEATFTLTDTGSRGVLLETPILNPPQVAHLATTLIEKRPVVVTDESGAESLAIRQMSYLCLTYDHRLVDGADAARFLGDLRHRLEASEMLAEFAD